MLNKIESLGSYAGLLNRVNFLTGVTSVTQRVALTIIGMIVFTLGIVLGSRLGSRRIEHVNAPAAVCPPGLRRDIEEAAGKINGLYEALVRNLRGLGGAEEEKLRVAIKSFRVRHGEEQPGCEKAFKLVAACEESLVILKALRPGLFLITVPGDGNCLFHALARGLQRLGIETRTGYSLLRLQVVDWMRRNFDGDSVLRGYVDQAIDDFIHSVGFQSYCELDASLELLRDAGRKYDVYFSHIDRDRFFASTAEIYAFSKMYPQIAIEIERSLGGHAVHIAGFDPSFNPDAPRKLILVHKDGCHFDLDVREG